ncbi:AI-2E family transporter [Candidatus Seribacter sulfatis]|uniref:AI-2E family transporter n=1 Tax=Candidatus Seribacter sulfatis TaxID=3381756 RepID=UPI00389A1636
MKDSSSASPILSDRQRKFLGFVACFAGALLLGCLLASVILILNRAFDLFGGVIWSLAISGMLAILLRPIVTFLEEKIKLGRFSSILLLYILVITSAGSATWLLGGKIIFQTKEFLGTAADWPDQLEEKAKDSLPPETWESISGQVESFKEYWKGIVGEETNSILVLPPPEQEIYDTLGTDQRETFRLLDSEEKHVFFAIEEKVEQIEYLDRKASEIHNRAMETMEKQGGEIAEKSAAVIQSAWSGLLGFFAQMTYLAVIPIYLFYFLSSNRNLIDELDRELSFLSDSVREDVLFLIREFVSILVSFFRGQLMIGLLMGVGYAIGFSISGLKFGITLGLLFGLLNIVPYLGSIVGIITALLVAYLQPEGIAETGEWNVLIGCGISFVIVQVIESYYLTPKIMGQQTGLHPVVVMVSIFFWGTALGGILGMIFGIPLTAFIIVAWRLLCRKYFNRSFC